MLLIFSIILSERFRRQMWGHASIKWERNYRWDAAGFSLFPLYFIEFSIQFRVLMYLRFDLQVLINYRDSDARLVELKINFCYLSLVRFNVTAFICHEVNCNKTCWILFVGVDVNGYLLLEVHTN